MIRQSNETASSKNSFVKKCSEADEIPNSAPLPRVAFRCRWRRSRTYLLHDDTWDKIRFYFRNGNIKRQTIPMLSLRILSSDDDYDSISNKANYHFTTVVEQFTTFLSEFARDLASWVARRKLFLAHKNWVITQLALSTSLVWSPEAKLLHNDSVINPLWLLKTIDRSTSHLANWLRAWIRLCGFAQKLSKILKANSPREVTKAR